jgi:hypothetical protein
MFARVLSGKHTGPVANVEQWVHVASQLGRSWPLKDSCCLKPRQVVSPAGFMLRDPEGLTLRDPQVVRLHCGIGEAVFAIRALGPCTLKHTLLDGSKIDVAVNDEEPFCLISEGAADALSPGTQVLTMSPITASADYEFNCCKLLRLLRSTAFCHAASNSCISGRIQRWDSS